MTNAFRIALMFLGVLVALFGMGVDFLLPSASPGLNLPQLLIILAGLGISVLAYNARRSRFRRRLLAGSRRSIVAAALVTALTMLVLELLLAALGFTTYFPLGAPEIKHRPGSTRICDEAGCLLNYHEIVDRCSRGELAGRLCKVNRQGYADDDDFDDGVDFVDRTRILALGDSFTQGFSAAVGKSFVETIEGRNPEIVVWNAAISGTGTNQAVASFEILAPILEPNLTILGSYGNDFTDNLLPITFRYEAVNHLGNQVYLRPFRFDAWDNLIPIDKTTALHYAAHGVYPPANELERLLGSARLGTLLLRLRDDIAEIGAAERRFAKGVEHTRGYLRQLRDLAASQSSALLVMLVPGLNNPFAATSERYLTAVTLLEELRMPYIDLTGVIPDDGYAPPPDGHWNSKGHQKVGALLSDCVQIFIASGNLNDCEHVVIP